MIASLYHSVSPVRAGAAVGTSKDGSFMASLRQQQSRGRPRAGASQKIVEVALGAHLAPQSEHVCGRALRVEPDEVARALPEVARSAQQLVHLVRRGGIEPQHVEV